MFKPLKDVREIDRGRVKARPGAAGRLARLQTVRRGN
jgi:hypothetical protein